MANIECIMKILETKRLILRTWKKSDLDPMCEINQDPKVMEYFSKLQDRDTTKKFINKVINHFDKNGYTNYAIQTKFTNKFIGFIGLLNTNIKAHFTPATGIGWRLSSKHWGNGYATEGAKEVLKHAFTVLDIPKIVSFTYAKNRRSIRVMEKIGLKHN